MTIHRTGEYSWAANFEKADYDIDMREALRTALPIERIVNDIVNSFFPDSKFEAKIYLKSGNKHGGLECDRCFPTVGVKASVLTRVLEERGDDE